MFQALEIHCHVGKVNITCCSNAVDSHLHNGYYQSAKSNEILVSTTDCMNVQSI